MNNTKILFAITTYSDNSIKISEMRNQTGASNRNFATAAHTDPKVIGCSFARYTEEEVAVYTTHKRYSVRRN